LTTIDIYGVKEQIVAILKDDTTNLFSSTPSDKTKFRIIEAGAPSPKAAQEPPLPRCWVTSDTIVANVTHLSTIDLNAHTGDEYELRINIVFVVEAKDGPKTEEAVDDFTKSIIEQMDTNYDLRTPSGAESTRVAESTELLNIQDLPQIFKGDRVHGRVIKYKVIVRA